MKKYIWLLPAFFLFACSDVETIEESLDDVIETVDSEGNDNSLEEQDTVIPEQNDQLKNAEDSIWNCKKVQALIDEIAMLSKGDAEVKSLTTVVGDEYFVRIAQASNTGDGSYITHVSFYVSPSKDWSIEYYKALDGIRIDFQEWNSQP